MNVGYFQEHPHFYSVASFNKGPKMLNSIFQERLPVRENKFFF